jgi:WD40 repeat protein
MPNAPSRRHIPFCIEVKMHPTNLNLILIGYEGGVVLWNFKDRRIEKAFELCFPPGAPGGSSNKGDALFSERRPQVTCLAWRPDGLLFAVGYDDGSLAFWSIEDEDRPIAVRTFDKDDVHLANAESIFEEPSAEEREMGQAIREPIFKVAWSGFRSTSLAETIYSKFAPAAPTSQIPPTAEEAKATNIAGTTMLTVMGGLLPRDPVGVHVLTLPPFVAPYAALSASATASSPNLNSATRQALKDSATPNGHTFYPTPTPAEDFCLLPQSPYYGSAFDPAAILISYGSDNRLPDFPSSSAPARSFNAYSFPPHLHKEQQLLSVPPLLGMTGEYRITKAHMETCTGIAYNQLAAMRMNNIPSDLPLKGGKGTPRLHSQGAGHILHASSSVLDRKKIMVTAHLNLTIRFWDVSSTLLALPRRTKDLSSTVAAAEEIVQHHFPTLLVEIDVRILLGNNRKLIAARLYNSTPALVSITGFTVSLESLEIAISLSTGEVILYRYGHIEGARDTIEDSHDQEISDSVTELHVSQPKEPESTIGRTRSLLKPLRPKRSSRREAPNPPTVSTAHMDLIDLSTSQSSFQSLAFSAVFALPTSNNCQCTCVTLSNIGFIATTWSGGTLAVVDLRGPDIILQSRIKDRHCRLLTWSICGIETGQTHSKGHTS